MPTQLDLYNRALNAIGARASVGSVVETSTEALALTAHYADLRKELLETWLWPFARRTAALVVAKSHPSVPSGTGTGTTWGTTWPSPPWLYQYTVPSDFLRARFVVPKTGNTAALSVSPYQSSDLYWGINPPYRFIVGSDTISAVEVDAIFTDVADAVLVYTADITDPNAWSAIFTQGMVFHLASRVAFQLTQDMEVTKLVTLQAQAWTKQAQVMAANQGLSPTVNIPDWIRVRGVSVADDSLGYIP